MEDICEDLETKMKLKEMVIYNFGDVIYTMVNLYEKFKKDKTTILTKAKRKEITRDNPYKLILDKDKDIIIKIIDVKNYFFDFMIANLYKTDILIDPIVASLEVGGNIHKIDLISNKQLELIIKQLNFINPCFYCNDCKTLFHSGIFNIFKHRNHDFLINDSYDIKELKNIEELNNYFPINTSNKFTSALKFEKNYNDYFNKNKTINPEKEFIYFEDIEGRKLLSDIMKSNYNDNIDLFFGNTGIGKSISVIHILKYEIEHNNYGTFYIHCKYLTLLEKEKNFIGIKRILISEIPFLFFNDFNGYKNCLKEIKDFLFSNTNTIWELIEIILKIIIKNEKKYIIVFDQYNNSCDKNNRLEYLTNNYIKNEKEEVIIKYYIFMSMNNKDVKEIKRTILMNIKDIKDKKNITEIDNFSVDKNFSNKKYQKIYEKIGKTLRNFHELNQISNEKKLNDYYDNKKKSVKKKMITYYNRDKHSYDLSLDGISDLIKFSVDIEYSEEEINSLIKFINFKYFCVKKIDTKFQVIYLYPIVEDVLKELFYSFVYENTNLHQKLLLSDAIKDGGKGFCFEEIVVSQLSPTDNSSNYKIKDLIISVKENIPKFILNENEVNIPEPEKIITLNNNTTYLIDQNIFGGRAIDFIIIDSFKNEQTIFAFQVSILKEDIYTIEEIKYLLIKMIELLPNYFKNLKISKDNVYFGYIFSLIHEKKPSFKTMINTCKERDIPYSFYSTKKKDFLNSIKHDISSIYEMAMNPFTSTYSINLNNQSVFGYKRKSIKNTNQKYTISIDKENKIKKILREYYKTKNIDYEYKETLNKKSILASSNDFFYTENSKGNSFLLFNTVFKMVIFNLDEIKNNNILEEHIINYDTIYDCYKLKEEKEKKGKSKEEKKVIQKSKSVNPRKKRTYH